MQRYSLCGGRKNNPQLENLLDMKNLQTLDKEGFLDVLMHLDELRWMAYLNHRCIHLWRVGSKTIFSPTTAVFYTLTGIELHRGSFWHPEITERFGLSRWDILDITYAEICCVCNGRHYDGKLRLAILEAVAPLVRAEGIAAYCEDPDIKRRKSSPSGW
ncbi:MAG: hypothetical protein UY62_C0081G0006 [Parcubacteria group bacterium GW2011_GWF2_50_9]|nr:MAG: hypothetical protein UY62_C0081G0006 [Parcubacteria group bacterium GW2011_GWF2_50_9]